MSDWASKGASVFMAHYGGRLRLRVCGLAFEGDKLLLLRHRGLHSRPSVWLPPGGEVAYGERLSYALAREFKEETGLSIRVQKLAFVCEYIQKPLHACELFFYVQVIKGNLKIGYDPETPSQNPIAEAQWMSFDAIAQKPNHQLHDWIALHKHQPAKLQNPLMFYSFAHEFDKK